jgi:hypothetical protein
VVQRAAVTILAVCGSRVHGSMKTALRLGNYEDILEPKEIYSLIALSAFYNQYYGVSSKAFIKLESLPNLTPRERDVRSPPPPPSPHLGVS